MSDPPRVLLSCPFVSPWLSTDLPPGWAVRARPSDFAMSRARATVRRVREIAQLMRLARNHDALVVSTASIELLALCLLRPLLGRCLLVAYDPLQASHGRLREMARCLGKRLDLVLCIRRSDLVFWQSARVCEFVPFLAPPPADGAPAAAREPARIYSAGDAHRDYAFLVTAAAGTGLEVTICTRQPVDTSDAPEVRVLQAVSPEDGRALQQASGISAIILTDTTLPAGPLVLLDAMAAGAAIVCTRSRGLVDYVNDREEAIILAEHAEPEELRSALLELAGDAALRRRLGESARARLTSDLDPARTIQTCVDLIKAAIIRSSTTPPARRT